MNDGRSEADATGSDAAELIAAREHQGPSFEGPVASSGGPIRFSLRPSQDQGKQPGTRAEGRELLVAFQFLLLA